MSKHKPDSVGKDPFDQLKSLLLTDDQQRVQDLEQRLMKLNQQLVEKDQLLETLDPVIVELLSRKINKSRSEVADVLAPVMGEAIKRQILESREELIDALYPIMGKLVIRSVTEAFKNVVNQINTTLEHSFSWERWKMRLKAKWLGVSPGELVLATNAPFLLEGVYLIAKDSGILISHAVQDHLGAEMDKSQLISGMLTAIKSFMETSFADGEDDDLQEINLQDRKIRIQSGRYSYLAVVYKGIASVKFDQMLRECHAHIYDRYYQKLRNYDGNSAALTGIQEPLLDIVKKMQAVEHD